MFNIISEVVCTCVDFASSK